MYNYEEIKEWHTPTDFIKLSDTPKYAQRRRKVLDVFRACWDANHNGWMGAPRGTRIIPHLAQRFGKHDDDIKSYMPLGKLRNIFKGVKDHSAMYGLLVERVHQEIDGSSIFEESMRMLREEIDYSGLRYARDFEEYRERISMNEFEKAFYTMLYVSTRGMAMEARVIYVLDGLFDKKTKGYWRVNEATTQQEYADIDAVAVGRNGESVPISVKCFGAFSEATINSKRNAGKTKPKVYAGITTMDATRISMMLPDFTKVNGSYHFFQLFTDKEAVRAK